MATTSPKKAARKADYPISVATLCKKNPTEQELLALRWAVLTLWDELTLIQTDELEQGERNRKIVAALDRWSMLPKRLTPKLRHGGAYVTYVGGGMDPMTALLALAKSDERSSDPHEHAALERVHKGICRFVRLVEDKRGEAAVPLGIEIPSLSAAKSALAKRSIARALRPKQDPTQDKI